MFICNFKLNGSKIVKISFICIFIIVLLIICSSVYKIFFKHKKIESNSNEEILNNGTTCEKKNGILEIDSKNYTNVLQAVHNDVDSYIGCKLHFSGYVYRLLDFEPNQFVLARDMLVSEDKSQTLVVGFLCSFDKAMDFEEGTWIDLIGTITKEDFHGEIPVINVQSVEKIDKPESPFVYPPDRTYIPTSFIF